MDESSWIKTISGLMDGLRLLLQTSQSFGGLGQTRGTCNGMSGGKRLDQPRKRHKERVHGAAGSLVSALSLIKPAGKALFCHLPSGFIRVSSILP